MKKFFYLSLCAVLVAFMAGCDGGESGEPPDDSKVTITFNSNGGSSVDPVKIDKGAALPREYLLKGSKVPKRDEYEFAGWKNGATPVTASTKFDTDATLIAQWEEAEPPPEYAASPAIHPGNHFLEIGITDGKLDAKVNVDFSANGLFSNMSPGAGGALSSKWYRVISEEDAKAATVAVPTGTVIIEQHATASNPGELSLPFTWRESTAGTYWYYVIVTNTNDKATIQKTSSAITQNQLQVTVTE